MQCVLMRHASALSKEEDPQRPLSPEGRKEAEATAALLARARLVPERAAVITSSKLRARQTAEILATALGLASPQVDENLSPTADPIPWAERLIQATQPVVLVGHLPMLARLAGYLLCSSRDREPLAFAPASAAGFVLDRRGTRLLWLASPALA